MSTRITDKIAALPEGSAYFSLEFFPPKTEAGSDNLLPRLKRLASLSPLFLTVTWGAGGSTAAKSLDLAQMTQQKLGMTTCLHLTCTNMSKDVLDHALEECRRIGIRNILALRGDEPRQEDYGFNGSANGASNGHARDDTKFEYAADLVRYIRQQHGDYFCIGVAAYPEGHACTAWPCTQSAEQDLPHLLEKTRAGADFIMTQLFYSADAYLRFEKLLREHESGAWKDIPIIPGLMPIQSWSTVRRVTKLCSIKIPDEVQQKLEAVKGDDEAAKRIGVDVLCGLVERIQKDGLDGTKMLESGDQAARRYRSKQGFHFYTLNLEKAVATVLEKCQLVAPSAEQNDEVAVDDSASASVSNGSTAVPTKNRRRVSSANSNPRNRVIVSRHSHSSPKQQALEVLDSEAGIPKDTVPSRAVNLAVAEGEGSLGREATWDDFPNGRWGDARSPAYGSIDGYGPSLHVSHAEALRLWGKPESRDDISQIFKKYLSAELQGLPWSEEGLSEETQLIRDPLLAMNERGWWSVASQPAVNGAKSSDPVVGWGPQNHGFVWQKPFVEFFLPSADWQALKVKLDAHKDDVVYFAGNAMGDFDASDEETVNPVTWGAFRGKEIATPTIIEAVSFREWQDEAFGIWRVWERVHPATSPSAKFLRKTIEDIWLVNVIGHDYVQGDSLWKLLLN